MSRMLVAGKSIRGWTLQEQIGSGSYGHVWSAQKGSETRAIKFTTYFVCHRVESAIMREMTASDKKAYFPTFFECSTANTQYGDMCWISMSKEGLSLQSVSDRVPDQCLPNGQALQVLECVTEALWAMQEKIYVHQNIKPGNLLLGVSHGKRRVLLTDFGTARSLDPRGLQTSNLPIRTDPYFSMEVANGGKFVFHDDIMSLFYTVLYLTKEDGFEIAKKDELKKTKKRLAVSHENLCSRNKYLAPILQFLNAAPRMDNEKNPKRFPHADLCALIKKNPCYETMT